MRSTWRAEVRVDPWDPRHEIVSRRMVPAAEIEGALEPASHPFAPIDRRAWRAARLAEF